MGEFRMHHCRFFDYTPQAIHCIAYNEETRRFALSRSDGSIEIWNTADNWFQELIFPAERDISVDALAWGKDSRLFSAGHHGFIHEHDTVTGRIKNSVASDFGAVWCLSANEAKTHLAAGTEEGCIVILDISTPEMHFERTFTKQEGRIFSVAWHDPENVIVSGGEDHVKIWSTKSGQPLHRMSVARQSLHKATIVWAVAVTSDFTIVSGDSRGKTSFWNGKQATLKKAFGTHKADVLAVVAAPDGRSVFAAGIDPTLVQFEYVPVGEGSGNWSQWVPTHLRYQHTHDVLALAVINGNIVSAGVDARIVYNNIEDRKYWRRIPPVPHISLVSFARYADIVCLQYPKYLELWRLGSTEATSEQAFVNLPVSKQPLKLLQMKVKGGEAGATILASTISQDATRLAYVDDRGMLRVYSISVGEGDLPKVEVTKIAPPAGMKPVYRLSFSPRDNDILVAMTVGGELQILKMNVDDELIVGATLPSKAENVSCHLLSVCPRGKYVAVADLNKYVHIYNIAKTPKFVCSLPQGSAVITAMAFHPTQAMLAVMHADNKLVEFGVVEEEYSEWSREFVRRMHRRWRARRMPITGLWYHPRTPHQIHMRDDECFYILDKSQPLPEPRSMLTEKSAIHRCGKYRYVMHMDAAEQEDMLLMVERPPLAITENLPPPFKKKKFGQ